MNKLTIGQRGCGTKGHEEGEKIKKRDKRGTMIVWFTEFAYEMQYRTWNIEGGITKEKKEKIENIKKARFILRLNSR